MREFLRVPGTFNATNNILNVNKIHHQSRRLKLLTFLSDCHSSTFIHIVDGSKRIRVDSFARINRLGARYRTVDVDIINNSFRFG